VNRSNYRTRHTSGAPGWGPAPGWDQPLPGWTPLLDHGPLPLRAAGSVARWWWPTLAVASFLAIAVYVTGHDPGPSQRGLLTIALAALVVVLLTIHRTAGPSRLARAAAEYTAVALLAALLTLIAGGTQQPVTPAAKSEAKHPATARAEASQDRPWVIRVAASVIRAVTRAVRAVIGAVGWLADLWRQADAKTDHPSRSPRPAQARGDGLLPRLCLDVDQEAAVTLRFADLNPLGRAIISVVAALTFGVAAISFATSYGALYAYARDTGLYSERFTRLWPLLLDGAFIVAQLAAILAGILRGSRGWPILTMLLTGALTVWFNLQHAGSDPGRRLAAALPPVLMMLAFEIDIQIVKWVMTALGRPLGPIAPPPANGMLPGAVWRSDGLDWNIPPHSLPGGWPPGSPGANWAGHRFPENSPNGQTRLPAAEGPDPAGVTKRQRIEAYLDRLAPEQLRNLTVREITSDLQGEGLEVTERYVKHILDQRRPTPASRRRGSGPRSSGR
jgi:hypothetical protein